MLATGGCVGADALTVRAEGLVRVVARPRGDRRDDEITGTKHSRDQFDNFGGCENFELHKRSVVACRRPSR